MATQSKDSEQLVQHPALLARNAGELKERASSSSPTTLVLLLVVPIVLVFFADFAFAVAMKSSEAQAGQRAAVKTTVTSSSGESASGGSGPDAALKDKRKTPVNQKCPLLLGRACLLVALVPCLPLQLPTLKPT
ncbi:uncharacterized protein [Dermacentor albipictus]|uniref:uncharacterized protein isoform X4 n=1 Tax=Dermacentor albipictus TaxID=60249 RepID=UPI0031FC459F